MPEFVFTNKLPQDLFERWLEARYKKSISTKIVDEFYLFEAPLRLTKHDRRAIFKLRDGYRLDPEPGSGPEAPTPAQQLRQLALPTITVQNVTNWRNDETRGVETYLPAQGYVVQHLTRDHIFLIDDSESMDPNWADAIEVFQALKYIIHAADPERVELFFTSEHSQSSYTSSLARLLSMRRRVGSCNMGLSLDRVFEPILSQLIWRPTTIYILTNGFWKHPDNSRWAVVKTIARLIVVLEASGMPADHVALRFIHFRGNTGGSHLEQLDGDLTTVLMQLKTARPRDIVEIISHKDSVWRMLFGSQDGELEGDGDEIQNITRGDITQDYGSSRGPDYAASVIHTDSGYASAPSEYMKGKRVADLDSMQPLHDRTSIIEESEPEEVEDLQPSDDETEFTDAQSLGPQWVTAYISEFSRDLLRVVPAEYMDEAAMEHLDAVLPGLLKEFALRIGHDPPTQQHGEIMYFVRKYRKGISEHIQESLARGNDDESLLAEVPSRDAPSMPLVEKLSNWHNNTPGVDPDLNITPDIPFSPPSPLDSDFSSGDSTERSFDDEDVQIDESGFERYRKCLAGSETYKWLLETLKRQALLATGDPDLKGDIRRNILMSLPRVKNRVSRKSSSEAYTAVFHTAWNPELFVLEQNYDLSPSAPIERAVTITGSVQDAQALTTSQYLSQTWGSFAMIGVIQDVLRRTPGEQCRATLADQTRVMAWFGEAMLLHVSVTGSAPSIADIGEQLAWLGAALRPSPRVNKYRGVWYCSPSVRCPISGSIIQPVGAQSYPCHFDIRFRFDKAEGEASDGTCWHKMFRNPVIVRGYPTARRANTNTGLEVPLGALVQLMNTKCVTAFHGKVFIKGFSSMLALIERKGELLLWHLFYNPEGGRVSYLEYKEEPSASFTLSQLEDSRHVVGWCSSAKILAGAKDGIYDVRTSNLPAAGSKSVVEKISISGGKFVTVGASIAIGVRETPLHLSREDYISKLDWISKKYVILWDEESKRGWLVNGPTALLHLVRGSLKQNIKGKLGHVYVFKDTDIKDPDPDWCAPHTADYAIRVLASQENRDIKIHPGKVESWEEPHGEGSGSPTPKSKTTFVKLEDRVEYFYHLLEKMIDHETETKNRSGVTVKPRVRKYLEGWEFRELSMRRDPIYPVVKTLPTVAKGWVDFARDIDAVTLFGRGFGDIIQPTLPDAMCHAWSKLPPNNHYLAASVSDLKDIMDLDDNTIRGPFPNVMRISDGLVWHAPSRLFESCQCRGLQASLTTKHSDFIQVLFPTRLKSVLRERATGARLEENIDGAVVFGHSNIFKWYWGDRGDPQRGVPPPEEPVEQEFYDSGIGSSYTTGMSLAVSSEQATDDVGEEDQPEIESERNLTESEDMMQWESDREGGARRRRKGGLTLSLKALGKRVQGRFIGTGGKG